jgi:hypothetical protein
LECRSEPFRRRENSSEQNAAAILSYICKGYFAVFVAVTICCRTPNSGLKESILFLEIFVLFIFGPKLREAGARSALFWRVNVPKKTGARSARARTRGQNPLGVLEKTTFKVWTNHFILAVL